MFLFSILRTTGLNLVKPNVRKYFRGRGSGSAFWSNMTVTVNVGSHTYLELSGPSDELIKFFFNLLKFVEKLGYIC